MEMPDEFVAISTRNYGLFKNVSEKNIMLIVLLADVFCEIWESGFYGGISQVQIEKIDYWQQLTELNPLG